MAFVESVAFGRYRQTDSIAPPKYSFFSEHVDRGELVILRLNAILGSSDLERRAVACVQKSWCFALEH